MSMANSMLYERRPVGLLTAFASFCTTVHVLCVRLVFGEHFLLSLNSQQRALLSLSLALSLGKHKAFIF